MLLLLGPPFFLCCCFTPKSSENVPTRMCVLRRCPGTSICTSSSVTSGVLSYLLLNCHLSLDFLWFFNPLSTSSIVSFRFSSTVFLSFLWFTCLCFLSYHTYLENVYPVCTVLSSFFNHLFYLHFSCFFSPFWFHCLYFLFCLACLSLLLSPRHTIKPKQNL